MTIPWKWSLGDEQAPDGSQSSDSQSGIASVGDALTLATLENYVEGQPATRLEVTPLKVLDNVPPSEFSGPAQNGRYFAVYLRIKNVGDGVYSDSPSNCVSVVNQAGNEFDATLMVDKTPAMASGIKLRSGSVRAGSVSLLDGIVAYPSQAAPTGWAAAYSLGVR